MKNNLQIMTHDLIISSIALAPGVLTIVVQYLIISFIYQNVEYKLMALSPLILIPFLFIFIVFLFRCFLPKVKEGRFKMELNKGFIAWAINLALGRSIRIFQLQDLIYSSYTLKYLYWRAMGANIAFGINSSMYVNLVDLPLIEIGSGSMIGDEVQISCHLIADNHIYLKKIIIGKESFIGINSKLGPGTKIGNHCKIGPWNFLLRHKIKDYQEVAPYTYFNEKSKG